tara:strand:- start:459 stop:1439 length:981 start_codon:yes stop_codon:yes gene_type:complete
MTDNTKTSSEEDFDWFNNNGIFMPMINDTGRNVAYKKAIEKIAPGSIMCDIGTGTGLLSILAAKAGAKKVYSIEMDNGRAEFARNMIQQLGLDDTIQVINKNFYKCDRNDIPDNVDYFVSETIGSPIFNEEIIQIANKSKEWGGVFVPGTIEVIAEVYRNHPILPLVYIESEAFEFQPDIEIDKEFEKSVNNTFQKQHPADSTLYRFNYVNNLLQQLPHFKADGIDLKFNCEYRHEPFVVDLNNANTSVDHVAFTIPKENLPSFCKHENFVILLKWRASMIDDINMNLEDTIWGCPAKTVLTRVRNTDADIKIWYDHKIENWRLNY